MRVPQNRAKSWHWFERNFRFSLVMWFWCEEHFACIWNLGFVSVFWYHFCHNLPKWNFLFNATIRSRSQTNPCKSFCFLCDYLFYFVYKPMIIWLHKQTFVISKKLASMLPLLQQKNLEYTGIGQSKLEIFACNNYQKEFIAVVTGVAPLIWFYFILLGWIAPLIWMARLYNQGWNLLQAELGASSHHRFELKTSPTYIYG